jgi:dTMP kinase
VNELKGKMIVLEGDDGSGKTTAKKFIVECLEQKGLKVISTREPGGTPFSEQVRHLILMGGHNVDPISELLMFYAARREHITKVIVPALEAGKWVVSDRFEESTRAYQGAGSGMSMNFINKISKLTIEGFRPDLTIVLNITAETALIRSGIRDTKETIDRFESEENQFKERVREYFAQLEGTEDYQVVRIDANHDLQHVRNEVLKTVNKFHADCYLDA